MLKKLFFILTCFAFFFTLLPFVSANSRLDNQEERVIRLERMVGSLLELTEEGEEKEALKDVLGIIKGIREKISDRRGFSLDKMERIIKNMREENYMNERGKLSLLIRDEYMDIGVDIVSDFDNNIAEEEMKGKIEIRVKGEIDDFGLTISLDFVIEIDAILKNDEFYFKVKGVPPIILEQLRPEEKEELMKYIDKWIFVPINDLEDMAKEANGDIDFEINKIIELAEKFLFSDSVRFTDMGKEVIEGNSANKYRVTLSKEGLLVFIEDDLISFLEKSFDEEIPQMTERDKEDLYDFVEWINKNIEFHISMDEKYIYKISLEVASNKDNVDIFFPFSQTGEEKFVARLDVFYSNFGESFSVEAPKKEIDLGKIIREEIEEQRRRAEDSAKRSVMFQIRSAAEAHYTFDFGYKGFEDSDYFNSIMSRNEDLPIEIHISEDGEDYCAITSFKLKNEYFCIDSTGIANTYQSKGCTRASISCE